MAWIRQRLAVSSARNTQRGTSPPPSGFCQRPRAPPRRGRFCSESTADKASGWLQGKLQPPKQAGVGALTTHHPRASLLLQVISQIPIFGAARNSFDCAERHVVLFDPGVPQGHLR
jgi:hypothetical protein